MLNQQHHRTRIKICGITDPSHAAHAVSWGVDAIGMILHANSPRVITNQQATKIRDVVPAFVSLVGVFVDAERELVEQSCQRIGLDFVQLHGSETIEYAQSLSRPYIKAIRAKTAEQVSHDFSAYPSAKAVLLDPYVKGKHGGTGELLDTLLWPSDTHTQALILAGGLSADNVAERIGQLSPFAVDLNSGLESEPGIKDPMLVRRAIEQVRLADVMRNEN